MEVEGNRTTLLARRQGMHGLGLLMTTAVTLGIVLATAGPAAAASTAPPVPVRAGLLLVAAIAGALIVVGLVIGAARTHRDH